jgi:hypothetical protein
VPKAPDYRDFSGDKQAEPQAEKLRWWELEGDEQADAISNVLQLLRRHQTQRLTQYLVSTRLYGNLPPIPFGGMSVGRLNDTVQGVLRDRISFNLVSSVVDTLTAKVSKNKPRPLFLTSGGDWEQQRRAKGLTRFCDGVFYEQKAERMMPDAQRDAAVYGDGVVHVYAKNERVAWERVLSVELYVDELEGYYGRPRQLHRVKDVDRQVLIEAYPDKAEIIRGARAAHEDSSQFPTTGDMVQVRESWHLPSGPDADDGKHVVSVDGALICKPEEWPHDWFPFARLPYAPRLYGYWAQGMAERLQPIQLEINKLLATIQRSMHLAGTFKIALENGSKVVKEHLNNDIGTIITYTGTRPEYVVPPIVQPEIYQHLQSLIKSGYDQEGISQLNSQGEKPAGLNSGRALREFDDINSDRFMVTGQNYEAFALDLARLSIATVKDIVAGSRKGYRVNVPSRGASQVVDWRDVELDEDDYCIKCFPVSALPQDPAGRLQTIQEYAQAGYLSPRQARRLLDFPDLEQVNSLANAMEDHLTAAIERIAYDGEMEAPEPYDDLAMAKELALEAYARGKEQCLPEDRLDLLRAYMAQVDSLMTPPPALMAPPGAAAGAPGSPQAAPMPPPQSDLIPNTPAPGVQQ